MAVVAFALARDAYAAPTKRVTIYCVQTYWRDRFKLARGKLEQFGSAGEAMQVGRVAAAKAAGVTVFRLKGFFAAESVGNVELDDALFERTLLKTFGETPGF